MSKSLVTRGSSPEKLLAAVQAAHEKLAIATTMPELKGVFDMARALKTLASASKMSLEVQNRATEVVLRTGRAIGEQLILKPKAAGARGAKGPGRGKRGDTVAPRFQPITLDQIGLDKLQSSQFQKLARAEKRVFEEHLVGATIRNEKLTMRGAIAAASHAPGYDGDESYTPEEYISAARTVMGGIDCDPAASSNPLVLARIGAKHAFTKNMEGQHRHWVGKVWLNPPYSTELIKVFVAKLLEELATNTGARTDLDQAIVLTNAATDTAWWQSLAQASQLVCIVAGRINFEQPDPKKPGELKSTKSNRFAQSFFYYGDRAQKFREVFQAFGVVGNLRVSGSAA